MIIFGNNNKWCYSLWGYFDEFAIRGMCLFKECGMGGFYDAKLAVYQIRLAFDTHQDQQFWLLRSFLPPN